MPSCVPVAVAASSQHACKCDARGVKMSTSALLRHIHSGGATRSQRKARCGGSSNCGNGISNFTHCLITCGLLLLLAAANGKCLCVFTAYYPYICMCT